MNRKKIYVNYVFENMIIPKIYNQLRKFNSTKKKNLVGERKVSCYVVHAGLELTAIFLPVPLIWWYYKCTTMPGSNNSI